MPGRRTARDTISERIRERTGRESGPAASDSPVVGPSSVGTLLDAARRAVGPSAPTRTPPPQPRTEPTAPPAQSTRPVINPAPGAGRGIGRASDVIDSRTFATVGGEEAQRRGISGNIQSGRSLFNVPGRNRLRGAGGATDQGRSSRGLTLTRGVGASPGSALAADSGAILSGGGALEQLLEELQLGG